MLKKKEYNEKLYALSIIIITLLIGFLFYILNYYTPLYADDYTYSFSFSTGERIESVSQIVDSQVAHYQTMNGRVVTHFLAQLFLLLGDNVFNIINVFSFLLLLYLIYFHSCGTFKNFSLSKFSMIAMLLFLSTPAFGQSFLWITGSSNYLYGILIILLFLVPYRIQIDGKINNCHILTEIVFSVTYFVFGIIAGWTNENTSVALVSMVVAYVFFFCIKSIRIHAWNITGGIGAVVGCVLMLIAPGNSSRLSNLGGSGGIGAWIKRFVLYSCDLIVILKLILLLLCVLLLVYFYQKQKQMSCFSIKGFLDILFECKVPFIYMIGFLASVYSMIVTPIFPGRVWSGPVVLILIAVFNLYSLIDTSSIKFSMGKTVTISFVLVLSIATFVNAYFDVKNVDSFYDERISMIEMAKEMDEKSVEIPNINGSTQFSVYSSDGDLNADSNEWPNTAIAKYYEVDKIIRGN